MTALLTLSGGVDSTFMNWDFLNTSPEPLIAVFYDWSNAVNDREDLRGEHNAAELIAATAVANWLKTNVRDFTFKVQPVSIRPGEWISLEACRQGGISIASGEADWFGVGRNREGTLKKKGLQCQAAQHRIYGEEHPGGTMQEPVITWSKPEMIQALPPELYDLTLGCNRASVVNNEVVKCGVCATSCLYGKLIKDGLAAGLDPLAIFDHGLRLMREGPYEALPITDKRWIVPGHQEDIDFPEKHSLPSRVLNYV